MVTKEIVFGLKNLSLACSVGMLLTIGISCKNESPRNNGFALEQPKLGYKSVQLLKSDNLEFKDLNKNNTLDPYEDWRLSYEDRAADLLSKMTLEQKVGFMIISTTRMENDWAFEKPKNNEPIGNGFNEDDLVAHTNMFTRKPLDYPNMSAAGTTKAVTEFHERHFILRANPPRKILAEWINNLQTLCESDGLGIPAVVTSNPRNHITMDASVGLSVGKTEFSRWPGELGLAAMRDFELVREFADIARQEWLAAGIRKGYMYMADLATEPRWQRVEGTFGEDAELAARMIREIVLGFQGEDLNSSSIALTTKHFPGGGATEGGQDPHFDWGKKEVFPGGMFSNNLIPFKAAIAAKTSSIMPYYSYPVDTKYEEVAYAYNKEILQDLLRGELGYQGIINSDTGPIDMMPWGVENLTIIERYKKAIEAGINLFSGTADPTQLLETVYKYRELEKLVDHSVYLLLLEKFKLGLFENPYVDIDHAVKTIGKKEFQDKADIALRKSIVLLRNETTAKGNVLPLKGGTKVYFETIVPQNGNEKNNIFTDTTNKWAVEFVDAPEKADVIVLWLIPKGKSLFASDGSPLYVSLSKNGIDIERVKSLSAKKQTILAINYSNPWNISEVYGASNSGIKGVLATFGTTQDALLDVVTGAFNPSGKMPFSTPISEEAAQHQKSDVPGYMEPKGYSLFSFDEGMSY
ncbi:glycoside hydrolase family 3 N-terminal domain-containing protein [Arenibacter sp. GZD96]|uniref:glycoside hydrolase family 3 protein n=1 Tax=Aurantibrevibacter litoralis TaxID=3106030 RepID=UPI002AFE374F|nr:glycoside hydrolase family 3 N-terminal domain-containing protein [Arenibacter sp. GZD-96]MEA1787096.1 glycoside hydrolase family 3 N-terminal domain-containing protein [Arenibacter sp. GZD-96]